MSHEVETLTYRGKLEKDGDGVKAVVRCPWGFSLIITGTRCEGGYDLTVVSGEIPKEYRLIIDDDTASTDGVSDAPVISE
jgi:hypothetical protein